MELRRVTVVKGSSGDPFGRTMSTPVDSIETVLWTRISGTNVDTADFGNVSRLE